MEESPDFFVRVLLVDDHQIVLDGVQAILEKDPKIRVEGQATNGEEALEFLSDHAVDLVITDMSMPQTNGMELTRSIVKIHSDIRVIILSMNRRKALIQEMMQAGASGYVLKDSSKEELAEAVKTVAIKGKTFLSQSVGEILVTRTQKLSTEEDLVYLTERETEILRHIAQEMSNEEVANVLGISRRTVETHRKNMMRKIGVRNSVGLARYAFSHGIVDGLS
ncbi:MAG: response regulator transcription factor [Bacteroidota bacterium]